MTYLAMVVGLAVVGIALYMGTIYGSLVLALVIPWILIAFMVWMLSLIEENENE
jgi:hypothetical protein